MVAFFNPATPDPRLLGFVLTSDTLHQLILDLEGYVYRASPSSHLRTAQWVYFNRAEGENDDYPQNPLLLALNVTPTRAPRPRSVAAYPLVEWNDYIKVFMSIAG